MIVTHYCIILILECSKDCHMYFLLKVKKSLI
nr:MAG TPA: hypothetical protein [Caudoviricetes sp.]